MNRNHWLVIALLGSLAAAPAIADDIRPEARALAGERPMADEKCIEKCDIESDKCMQDAEADSGKVQLCDDTYSKCLQTCEGG